MPTAVAFIDARDGMFCTVVEGQTTCYESHYTLALVLNGYGIRYAIEPPSDEDWPDYVTTDARFYLAVNEELAIIRDLVRDHQASRASKSGIERIAA